MVASFAAIVLLCGFFAADALSLLVSYHRLTPPDKLSDTADFAPPERLINNGPRRLASQTTSEPTPTASVSPAASEYPVPPTEAPVAEQQTAPNNPEEEYTSSAPAPAFPVADYPEAKENTDIAVQGILKGTSTGVAVIEYQGDTLTVSPGDSVGSYKVTAIQSDRVLFDNNGESSQVRIATPRDSSASVASAPSVGNYPPVLPAPDQVPLPPQPVTLPPVGNSNPVETFSYAPSGDAVYNITDADLQGHGNLTPPANELSRKELEEFTRKGAALLADIRGTEVENGRGVQVKFRNPDNALAKLGMQDGDVVLRINSKSVYGVEDIYNAVLTMRDAPQIDIEVSRNGQPVSLFHKFPERYE